MNSPSANEYGFAILATVARDLANTDPHPWHSYGHPGEAVAEIRFSTQRDAVAAGYTDATYKPRVSK